MADSVTVRIFGDDFAKSLRNMDPRKKPKLVQTILLRSGHLIQTTVATKTIKRGGSAEPLPNILTSRTGTLRRSQFTNVLTDRSVEVGTDLVYGPPHEQGGTFNVRAHSRRVEGKLFNVKAHKKTFPRRPFLEPALEQTERGRLEIAKEEWQKVINDAPVPLPPSGKIAL